MTTENPSVPELNGASLSGIFLAFCLLMSSVLLLKVPVALALFAAWFLLMLCGWILKVPYPSLQAGLMKGIMRGMEGVLIITCVGAVVGSWIAGGIVPTVIYYGLSLVHPGTFLPIAFLACALTSLVTGTSFASVGTVGVAMMGVGAGFEIPLPYVAGAVISGAYVGDAISPLSDTTILSSSLCDVSLIDHVRSMAWVGLPAGVLVLGGFYLLGMDSAASSQAMQSAQVMLSDLDALFVISPMLLLPLLITLGLLMARKPAIPVIAIGAFLGVLCAWWVQGATPLEAAMSLYQGYSQTLEGSTIGGILSRGGIQSMLPVVVIVIFALGLGGLMESLGVIRSVGNRLSRMVKGDVSLTLITVTCGFFGSVFGGAAYVSLFTASAMTRNLYEQQDIERRVLSRNCEAGGTLSCPMIPWTSGAVFMAATTGVATLDYLPYLFYHFAFMAGCLISAMTGLAFWKGRRALNTAHSVTTSPLSQEA